MARLLLWLGLLSMMHAGMPMTGHAMSPAPPVAPARQPRNSAAHFGGGAAWILPTPPVSLHAAAQDRGRSARRPVGRVARRGGMCLRASREGGEGSGEQGEEQLTVVEALREWDKSRRLSQHTLRETPGSRRKQVSVLFVSNRCVRAILAEKLMTRLLETKRFRSKSPEGCAELGIGESRDGRTPFDRLLVLSAGLDNLPGAPIVRPVMAASAEQGIDITEDNPCARFHETDLDMFDLIVCMDVEVRERVLELAMQYANSQRGVESALIAAGIGGFQNRYAEYEKKVVLAGGAHKKLIVRSEDDLKGPLDKFGVPHIAVGGAGVEGPEETQKYYQHMKEVIPVVESAVAWSLQLLLTIGL